MSDVGQTNTHIQEIHNQTDRPTNSKLNTIICKTSLLKHTNTLTWHVATSFSYLRTIITFLHISYAQLYRLMTTADKWQISCWCSCHPSTGATHVSRVKQHAFY